MKYNILINPTIIELLKKKRECLYEWDGIRATIVEKNILVWFDDVHHVDLMKKLKIDYNSRYDIVIYMDKNKVVMTKLYDRKYSEKDINKVKNDKHLKKLLREFEVELEYE